MTLYSPDRTITYEVDPAAKDTTKGLSMVEIVFNDTPGRPDWTTHAVHQGGKGFKKNTHDIVVCGLSVDEGVNSVQRLVGEALQGVDNNDLEAVQRAIMRKLDEASFLKSVEERIQR